MIDNWYEAMDMVKMRNEAILHDLEILRMRQKVNAQNGGHSVLSITLWGNLGKAFSSIGDSLQSHYHFGADFEKKNMRKVS